MERIKKENVSKLRIMAEKLFKEYSLMLINNDSGCRVHVFDSIRTAELQFTLSSYYFCMEMLAKRMVDNNKDKYISLMTDWINMKESIDLDIIEYLWDYYITNVDKSAVIKKPVREAITKYS